MTLTNHHAKIASLVGFAFVLVSLALGFFPMHSAGYSCGSVFHENSDLFSQELTDSMLGLESNDHCSDMKSNREPFVYGGLVLGGMAFLGGLIILNGQSMAEQRRDDEHAQPPTSA